MARRRESSAGAVRNALLGEPVDRMGYCHDRPAGRGHARCRRARAGRSCRPASSMARSPSSSTAMPSRSRPARGCRDRRSSCRRAVRPGFPDRRAASGLHHQCPVRDARRRAPRLCRGSRRSCRAPCSLHRRAPTSGSRRTICASSVSSASTPAIGHGPIDRRGFAAAIRHRAGLARLSRERVRAEMLKLLSARGAATVLGEIDGAGFLLAVLGGVARVATFARLAEAEADLGVPVDPLRRLAALSLFSLADVPRLSAGLRLSNAETRRLELVAGAIEQDRRRAGRHRRQGARLSGRARGCARHASRRRSLRRVASLDPRPSGRGRMGASTFSLRRRRCGKARPRAGSEGRPASRRGGTALDRGGLPRRARRAGGNFARGARSRRGMTRGRRWRCAVHRSRFSVSRPAPRR